MIARLERCHDGLFRMRLAHARYGQQEWALPARELVRVCTNHLRELERPDVLLIVGPEAVSQLLAIRARLQRHLTRTQRKHKWVHK